MKRGAYYNEFDGAKAAWLRELIARNLIAPGDVDERSIADVQGSDLAGYAQCHFFAGIGVWSHALRLAAWPDDREVWTGSCPCQPFSSAGKGLGTADARHLWPHLARLIRECAPSVVFGEQVGGKAGRAWLDLVYDDLEADDYAVGAGEFPACSVGAPHIRQRLYWVADAGSARLQGHGGSQQESVSQGWQGKERHRAESSRIDGVALAAGERREWWRSDDARLQDGSRESERSGDARRLAVSDGGHASTEREQRSGEYRFVTENGGTGGLGDTHGPREHASILGAESGRLVQDRIEARGPGPVNGFWLNADWLPCRDEKWRPVESGTFPLAHGAPERMGRLRGYGDAIVASQAATWIEVCRDALSASGADLA